MCRALNQLRLKPHLLCKQAPPLHHAVACQHRLLNSQQSGLVQTVYVTFNSTAVTVKALCDSSDRIGLRSNCINRRKSGKCQHF